MSVPNSPGTSPGGGSVVGGQSPAPGSHPPSPAEGARPKQTMAAAAESGGAAATGAKRKVGAGSSVKAEPTMSKKEVNRLAQQQARFKKAQYIAELETKLKVASEREGDKFHHLRAIIGAVIEENRQLRKLCQTLAGFLTEGLPSVLPRMGMTPALYDAIITQGEHEAAIDAFNRTKDRLDREREARVTGDGAAASTSGKKKAGTKSSKSSSRAPSPPTQAAETVPAPVAALPVNHSQIASSGLSSSSTEVQTLTGAPSSSVLGQQPLASGSGSWGAPLVASAYAAPPTGFTPPAMSHPPPPPPTFVMPATHFQQPQSSFSNGLSPSCHPTGPAPSQSTAPPPSPMPPVPPLDVWSTSSALAYLSSFSADQPWPTLVPGAPSPASLAWAQQTFEPFDDPFAPPPPSTGLEQKSHQPPLPDQSFGP